MDERDLQVVIAAAELHNLIYEPTVSESQSLWPQLSRQTIEHLLGHSYVVTPGRSGDMSTTEYGAGPLEFLLRPQRGSRMKSTGVVFSEITVPWFRSKKHGKFAHPTEADALIVFLGEFHCVSRISSS